MVDLRPDRSYISANQNINLYKVDNIRVEENVYGKNFTFMNALSSDNLIFNEDTFRCYMGKGGSQTKCSSNQSSNTQSQNQVIGEVTEQQVRYYLIYIKGMKVDDVNSVPFEMLKTYVTPADYEKISAMPKTRSTFGGGIGGKFDIAGLNNKSSDNIALIFPNGERYILEYMWGTDSNGNMHRVVSLNKDEDGKLSMVENIEETIDSLTGLSYEDFIDKYLKIDDLARTVTRHQTVDNSNTTVPIGDSEQPGIESDVGTEVVKPNNEVRSSTLFRNKNALGGEYWSSDSEYVEYLTKLSYEDLMTELSGLSNPEQLNVINQYLNHNYTESDFYSPVEKLIYSRYYSDGIQIHFGPDESFTDLENIVQTWIQSGVITEGADANDAQARLAARLIYQGINGAGTDKDNVYHGLSYIRCPKNTGDITLNHQYTNDVINRVDTKIKNVTGETLEEYLKGDLSDDDYEYACRIYHMNGIGDTTFLNPIKLAELKQQYANIPKKMSQIRVLEELYATLESAVQAMYHGGESVGYFSDAGNKIFKFFGSQNTEKITMRQIMDYQDTLQFLYSTFFDEEEQSAIFANYGIRPATFEDYLSCYGDNGKRLETADKFDIVFFRAFGKVPDYAAIDKYYKVREARIQYNAIAQTYKESKKILDNLKEHEPDRYIKEVERIFEISDDMKANILVLSLATGTSEISIYETLVEQLYAGAETKLRVLHDEVEGLGDINNLYNNAYANADGRLTPMGKLLKTVADYTETQMIREGVCKGVTDAILFAAVLYITGGTGGAAAYGLISAGSSLTVNLVNKGGIKDGYGIDSQKSEVFQFLVNYGIGYLSEGLIKSRIDKFGEAHGLKNAILYKMVTSSVKDGLLEATRQIILNSGNEKKAIVKSFFAAFLKGMIGIKVMKNNFSKNTLTYIFDKGPKKALTNGAYSGVWKEYHLQDAYNAFVQECNNDSTLKNVISDIPEEELKTIFLSIIDDLANKKDVSSQHNNSFANDNDLPSDNTRIVDKSDKIKVSLRDEFGIEPDKK